MKVRARLLLAGSITLGAVTTLSVMLVPFIYFAYQSSAAHAALETAEGLVALLVTVLVYGRFRLSRSTGDLVLVVALGIIAVNNLVLSVLLPVILETRAQNFQTWAPLVVRLVGAGTYAVSPFLTTRRRKRGDREGGSILAVVVGVTVALSLVTALLSGWLPSDIAGPPPEDPTGPWIRGHGAILVLQAISMFLFALATFGFSRRAAKDDDELMAWFAAGSALSAFARLNYILYPVLHPGWVYAGDLLRFGFYLMLLIGGGREITSYWSGQARAAVMDERRRIARDLHDGLAGELFFISAQSRMLESAHRGDPDLARLVSASERALYESRRAITSLSGDQQPSLREALADIVERVAQHSGASVTLDIAPDVEPTPLIQEALLRIAREATTNAIRHGRARSVEVSLSGNEEVHLKVADDGIGFDPDGGTRPQGFGIVSMRERAESLDGRFRITSQRGGGTEVEVVVPQR